MGGSAIIEPTGKILQRNNLSYLGSPHPRPQIQRRYPGQRRTLAVLTADRGGSTDPVAQHLKRVFSGYTGFDARGDLEIRSLTISAGRRSLAPLILGSNGRE